jgi:hypothetical protein
MRKGIVCSLLLFLSCATGLLAQVFQNLDFEDANLSVIPSGQFGGNVSITNALPSWTGYLGTNQVTQVLQNNLTLGAASIDIFGPVWNGFILQGQYTAELQAGLKPGADVSITNLVNASLAQVGLVPANAKSITLEAAGTGTNLTVSFAGQTILLSAIGSGPNYTLFGGDISSFAGQVGELRLSTLSPLGAGVLLDAITFSTQAIPEPNSFTLLMMAVTGLGLWRLTSRKTG